MEEKKTKGGARPGAGRPADPSIRVMVRMKPRLHDRIKEQAKAEGQTIPEWIRQAAEDKLNSVQN